MAASSAITAATTRFLRFIAEMGWESSTTRPSMEKRPEFIPPTEILGLKGGTVLLLRP